MRNGFVGPSAVSGADCSVRAIARLGAIFRMGKRKRGEDEGDQESHKILIFRDGGYRSAYGMFAESLSKVSASIACFVRMNLYLEEPQWSKGA
jgi:hypothetical protein